MKKRLFVALDLPEKVKTRVEPLCSGLPGARWINSEQLHLTLSFIGEVDGSVFHDIMEGLEEISFAPFTMRLDGMGFFPPRGKPRVVWVGVEQNDALMALQRKIHTRLLGMGLELETRKYSPHITLARLKNTPASKVAAYLEQFGLFQSEPFSVDSYRLYSSTLTRNGAIHVIEREYGGN